MEKIPYIKIRKNENIPNPEISFGMNSDLYNNKENSVISTPKNSIGTELSVLCCSNANPVSKCMLFSINAGNSFE